MGMVTVFGMRLLRFTRNMGNWAKTAAIVGLVATIATPAASNSKYAGIVVDAKTGKTLYASSADAARYPASLTKIMTLYVVFEELEAGRLSLSSKFKVSKYAAGRPPSKLGLKPGSTITVKDAILALVTKSANDVATTVAENIGGSEAKFAQRMTRTARQIGMKKTTFRNPHGLPNSKQRTTARDMALLGRAIQERFPQYYGYFKTRAYSYKGRRYGNHNKLLGRVKGVDGIKTGYIRASGFNLVSSVKRDGRHIVAVVMGGRTGRSRDAQMVKLINKYLSKASRGPKTAPALVQRRITPSFRAADLKDVPLPNGKPGAIQPAAVAPVTLALVKPDTKRPDPTQLVTGTVPVPPKQVKNRMSAAFSVAGLAPIPQDAPATSDLVQTEAKPVVTMVEVAPIPREMPETQKDSVTVATSDSQEQEPGWQVQIAAAESETGAIEMLKRAKSKTGSALRARIPYTEPVEANGQTLYRARFVGFETKTAALRACKTLKQAKFACYAIYQ
ncbi:serine hydrolase [Roseibium sp.]|uniref:serine hydrolase n=1 Tax=Roseibium sp. TaxID=1936156 RepID=UPI003A972A35